MATVLNTVFKLKRGIASRWAEVNPILHQGEPGFVIDLNRLKIGDGIRHWNDLPYLDNEQLLADNQTIVIENNTISLKGFIEAKAGAQLTKNANGELEWILPSTDTIDGLTEAVTVLKTEMLEVQNDINVLADDLSVLSNLISHPKEGLTTRVQTLEHQVNETGEGTIDALINKKIDDFATKISDDGTVNTLKELIDYVDEHGSTVDSIINDINNLKNLVGNTSVNNQILANNQTIKLEADNKYISKKYEILTPPAGTLVNYGDREIRIMVPKDTVFTKQNVGATGNANVYYITFRTYAPNNNVVGYKEHLNDQVDSSILTDLKTDAYGRKYQTTWLGVASYDSTTGTWSYYGKNSTTTKYIGWNYGIDWYDNNNVMIASDRIRINLSNENCHDVIEPYYSTNTIRNIKINNTILDTIDHQVNIKFSDNFDIADDGTIGLKQISWDLLVPGETTLILDGGDATNEG